MSLYVSKLFDIDSFVHSISFDESAVSLILKYSHLASQLIRDIGMLPGKIYSVI
jgi:hypothetical protein